MANNKKDEVKCVLCGKERSADTASDFLRECFMLSHGTDDKPVWDKGLMQPRLNFIELGKIHQGGSNDLCHNRSRCRARQATKSYLKRAVNKLLDYQKMGYLMVWQQGGLLVEVSALGLHGTGLCTSDGCICCTSEGELWRPSHYTVAEIKKMLSEIILVNPKHFEKLKL